MLDVSWSELAVLTGVGLFLIGRRDLPAAARTAGTQVGRIVGVLHGMRARADRFASQHELRQLQNELRSGLRELDHVKAELATSLSPSRGLVGRNLGALTRNVNNNAVLAAPPQHHSSAATLTAQLAAPPGMGAGGPPPLAHTSTTDATGVTEPDDDDEQQQRPLASVSQTIAAVAEDTWVQQGMGFTSRADAWYHRRRPDDKDHGTPLPPTTTTTTSSSMLLAQILQQSLIHDQYDRVVRQQDAALQNKWQQKLDALQQQQHPSRPLARTTMTDPDDTTEPPPPPERTT